MGAIDADAHVIETVQTWSYMEGKDARFTPKLLTQIFGEELKSNEGLAVRDFWVIEDAPTARTATSAATRPGNPARC